MSAIKKSKAKAREGFHFSHKPLHYRPNCDISAEFKVLNGEWSHFIWFVVISKQNVLYLFKKKTHKKRGYKCLNGTRRLNTRIQAPQ